MSATIQVGDIDARLELEIDAAYESMVTAPSDAESRDWFTELTALIARRSPRAWMKIELERRMRAKARKA